MTLWVNPLNTVEVEVGVEVITRWVTLEVLLFTVVVVVVVVEVETEHQEKLVGRGVVQGLMDQVVVGQVEQRKQLVELARQETLEWVVVEEVVVLQVKQLVQADRVEPPVAVVVVVGVPTLELVIQAVMGHVGKYVFIVFST
jgi:hypothetical protein